MQCEKIQELILTDYLDNEISREQSREVKLHLAGCHQCREFAQNAQKAAVEPFEDLERLEPSPHVWQNIKDSLEGNRDEAAVVHPAEFWERFKWLFAAPRPAFALATVAVIVLMSVVIIPAQRRKAELAQIETQEQIEYLASLVDEYDYSNLDENGDYGTVIEKYFL